MQSDFRRVAIVNRGEPAVRFIHAVQEFNHENATSLKTIALFTDPDRRAMFVREADETVPLGPARVLDEETGQWKSAYVDYTRLAEALSEARADAVWAGWGFVAEHARFADLCRDMGIVFIGPDAESMRKLGDKITAKQLAEQAGVPVAPWSGTAVESVEDAAVHAERLGFPVLIKAAAGGGGYGIRRANCAAELRDAFEGARLDARKVFGNPTVFIEQLVTGARHIEVQIIADHYGTIWAAGVRDCTIQRRHQKILEEAPSPVLAPEEDRSLRDAAVRLARAAGYRNAGTVEFLYQPDSRRFLFMEMNTRLQVEHPVTECTTGLDLVKLQIHIARGGHLEGEPPQACGHAIEVRLNAEDAANCFAPAPGVIERFRIGSGPGIRVDTGFGIGDTVPAEFDSMMAKIIATGRTRKEAISRLRRCLHESVIVVNGGTSNRAFLLQLLDRPEVELGTAHVEWLDDLAAQKKHFTARYAEIALIQAAIETYESERAVEQSQFYASALRGRPDLRTEVGRTVKLRYRNNSYSLRTFCAGFQQYRIETGGVRIDAQLERLGQYEFWLAVFDRRFRVVSVPEGLAQRIELDGVSLRVERDDAGIVRSPAPAVVVSVAVKKDDTVSAGDSLAVLEAMKMEMHVVAPFSGRVRQVMAVPFVQVNSGVALFQLDPGENADEAPSEEPVKFDGIARPAPTHAGADSCSCREQLAELRRLMLGFDVDPAHTKKLVASCSRCSDEPRSAETIAREEDGILSIFADVCSLFQRRPESDDPLGGEAPTAESYLFAYLRALDSRGEGLPPGFADALRRSLRHYDIASLDRTPELEQAMLWICKSHQRVDQQIAPVIAVLERRLRRIGELAPSSAQSLRVLLGRLIDVTRGLFPSVSDLAREILYRYFDQPMFERLRSEVYLAAEDHLAKLVSDPDGTGRHEHIRALIECPQPLESLFAARFFSAAAPLRRVMLEVLVARYYRIRTLTQLHSFTNDKVSCVGAEYEYEDRRIHLLATYAEYNRLAEAIQAISPLVDAIPPDHDVVVDLFVSDPGRLAASDEVQSELNGVLNRNRFTRPVRRIVVAISGEPAANEPNPTQHFTYRAKDGGYEEERLSRGLHPMMAKRLHLWRLNNFKIERLPSAEDVYLFHGVAYQNPKDERLFAFAEVRDLTPVRDSNGRVVQLPHLERVFAECVAAIRLVQSRRAAHQRLRWNRVFLYVWPPIELAPEEMNTILHKLAPAVEELGLERVVVRARIPHPRTGELRDMIVRISSPAGSGLMMTFRPADNVQPLRPLSEYDQKVVRMRQRGLNYPYEIIKMLTRHVGNARGEFPPGIFIEHDLDDSGRLVPVTRAPGQNSSNIVAGIIRNFTLKYPDGMHRVMLLGDPSRDLGALAEPECRRIIAAIDLAELERVPLEWFAISAGAKISMDSGVENMDWIARVLRRLIEFTQAGGEVNVIVDGINVGAQPYWNAEATMLMHTRGILVMTPKAAMVLTGKRALEYSGSVSAEDNEGIGGYGRIMGINGQAQYWAADIDEACWILLRHYDHTYIAPGERFPRRAFSTDAFDRDVRSSPHDDSGESSFVTVGDIFSDTCNPARKKSFDIRKVMRAVADQDQMPLERWAGMRAAETAVVWDAHLGGYPVCLIGIESKPVPRLGLIPADGPDQWTAGTLFPLSSKKLARSINAASNNRPVVILANLSGFDGSPESMRALQLEYGAEIGRAVVNFQGPIVFCVVSRYHGGAYVVFSRALNENLEVLALEGTYASVIGGAPAAAVVFAGEVENRTRADARMKALGASIANASEGERGRLTAEWNELYNRVRSEKLGEVADEFDRVHSVHRALEVGALNRIIPPDRLRPCLIDAVERGMRREEAGIASRGLASIGVAAV